MDPQEHSRRIQKLRGSWAKHAAGYDRAFAVLERRVFGDGHRAWAARQASGEVLEVAVGTGLNLMHYPQAARLTGVDLSPEMMQFARTRARVLGREVNLYVGDAQHLALRDDLFDAVVCTYSLCNIPDPSLAITEMRRVLRPAGKLILVDHIRAAVEPVFWLQKGIEFFTGRLQGEFMTRRPAERVEPAGLTIIERERLAFAGIVERVVALKP